MAPPDHDRSALYAVAENATLALFLMDARQHCTYLNPAAERLTGFSLDEVLARDRPLHDIIHHRRPDGRPYPLAECPIDRALPARARAQGEDVFVHKDGHFYAVAFTASPIVERGVPVGTVVEVRDLTAERRTADALREIEARYRFLAEVIPVQVWTALPDGGLDFVTEQTARHFGLAPGRLLEAGWQAVVHPDDLPAAVERWRHSLSTGEPYEVEFRLRLADGTYATHLARAVPRRGPAGEIDRWFGTNTNIEEQRERRRRTQALLDEVVAQARESEAALRALRRAKESADARAAELEARLAAVAVAPGREAARAPSAPRPAADAARRAPGRAAAAPPPLAIDPYPWLDYYDHCFERAGAGVPVWRRNTRPDFPPRRAQLLTLAETLPAHGAPARVPPFGVAGGQTLGGPPPAPTDEVVAYENESLHQGRGRYRARLADVPSGTLWVAFVSPPGGKGESVRWLRVGARAFALRYRSDEDWRSNVGTTSLVVEAVTLPPAVYALTEELMRRAKSPLLAVDCAVDGAGGLWATDLNWAPGLRGSGVEEYLPARACADEIKRAFFRLRDA
jgi:PAS domain S-box-containing protein